MYFMPCTVGQQASNNVPSSAMDRVAVSSVLRAGITTCSDTHRHGERFTRAGSNTENATSPFMPYCIVHALAPIYIPTCEVVACSDVAQDEQSMSLALLSLSTRNGS